MPDVQEVFRMSTQKVRQDPGAMERQVKRQHKAARNRKLGAFAVVAGIVAVALVVVVTNLDRTETPGGVATQPPPIGAQSGPVFLDLQTGETTPLAESIGGIEHSDTIFSAVSPDGTKIAYNPCCDPPVAVSVANIDGTDARKVTPDLVDAYGAQWMPDGDSLVYQGRDGFTQAIGNLFVLNIGTGDTTQITDLGPVTSNGWFLSPEPSPDGTTVLFQMPRGPVGSSRYDLWTVPLKGGEPTLVQRNAGFGVYNPRSGDLAYLDAPREDFSSKALYLEPNGSDQPRILARGDAIMWPRFSPDGTRIAYTDGGEIHIVEVADGRNSVVAEGERAVWVDADTLIVWPF